MNMASVSVASLSQANIRRSLKSYISSRLNEGPNRHPAFARMLAQFSDTFDGRDSLTIEHAQDLQEGSIIRGTFFFTCRDVIYGLEGPVTNNSAEFRTVVRTVDESPILDRIQYQMSHPRPKRFRML